MLCARHPDREATLAIDLPSIGVQVHWCEECKAAYNAKHAKPYLRWLDPATPEWEKGVLTGNPGNDVRYAYRRSVGIGGKLHGEVQWLHPSQRKR